MKKSFGVVLIFLVCIRPGPAEVSSLSHVFALGKGVRDLDGDTFGDKIGLTVVVPDNASAAEIALAADIAARANLESLAQDFDIVQRESERNGGRDLTDFILIGPRLRWVQKIAKEQKINLSGLGPNQGLVFVFHDGNQKGIACVGGSEEMLLRTGRAFFLRWPYFWEVWGREEGATYLSFENDLARFLSLEQITFQRTVIRKALYEFPGAQSARETLKGLSFTSGEIKDLDVEVYFTDEDDLERASKALDLLRRQRRHGQNTEVLSYPGCAQVTFKLGVGKPSQEIVLSRPGSTKRLLTPGYKEAMRADGSGHDFDLLSLFSAKGFYSDGNRDGILDGIDSSIIIPQSWSGKGLAWLTSKLILFSCGASFPLVYLDSEIEQKKSLVAPILAGPSRLTHELIKTGKFKPPALENAWGVVEAVPKAFNKSSALVIHAPDNLGLEKTLSFLGLTFPFFEEYRDGSPQLQDAQQEFERFLKGENGSAEAFFDLKLREIAEDLKEKDLETFEANLILPRENKKYGEAIQKRLESLLHTGGLAVKMSGQKQGKLLFEKEKAFPWEATEAVTLALEKTKTLKNPQGLKISLGISESPEVRAKIRAELERGLQEQNTPAPEVEVLSAYKQGFFWITEKIMPSLKNRGVHHLTIRFAEEKENLKDPKRFYSEPIRWLQELYPVDEILAGELGIPLERIEFEASDDSQPIYEVRAFDDKNAVLLEQGFSPRMKDIPFLNVLPEWGVSRITCGWLRISDGQKVILDIPLQTDLERFWNFYQEEVLRPLYSHVMKKTGFEPVFSKQPYFKRLLVEVWASEPDYRLGLDEEIISSLESLHDEIYFDTLDFLRGITRFDEEDRDLPEDTSRSSAPGNILPLIHPSLEGKPGRVKVVLEDWAALAPKMELKWKESGRDEATKTVAFPDFKPKNLVFPSFIYNGQENRIENLFLSFELEKDADYLALLDTIESFRKLEEDGLVEGGFQFPNLKNLTARIRCQGIEKEETLPVSWRGPGTKGARQAVEPDGPIVPTDRILSPEMVQDIVGRLARFRGIRSFSGGKSYEGRDVPVLEIYSPFEGPVSIPRLITFKPTLHFSSRQHANEVSSTNYLLKFAELVAGEKAYQDALRKMNLVLQPMENPDGAALAFDLQKVSPFHSLHAGRYSSLGVDIGYQVGAAKPLLPEASVRTNLYNKWLPDIYLNLHGYPSHEWVQQFSNYSPYLFRDYWIPRGWFAYYRMLSLAVYDKWRDAGNDLLGFITQEIQSNERIKESNKKFYDRYYRWAGRWQPHMDFLELSDGVNIYAKRRSSQENKLTFRSQVTFVEQTPELMDETATGPWLQFLCEQGLAYLRAHVKYLSRVKFETARIEEEIRDRIRIEFIRSRPGTIGKGK